MGCAAGFLNVGKIKGIHNAMKSGMLAAETIVEELSKPQIELKSYSNKIKVFRQVLDNQFFENVWLAKYCMENPRRWRWAELYGYVDNWILRSSRRMTEYWILRSSRRMTE